jgi:hypothetical protein
LHPISEFGVPVLWLDGKETPMKPVSIHAPVLITTFRRPDALMITLSALAACNGADKTTVWIASDSPSSTDDEWEVNAVREVLRSDQWVHAFAEFRVIEREVHHGRAQNSKHLMELASKQWSNFIYLEEDIKVEEKFLDFLNWGLNEFGGSESISFICAGRIEPLAPSTGDFTVDQIFTGFGFAAWFDRWCEVLSVVNGPMMEILVQDRRRLREFLRKSNVRTLPLVLKGDLQALDVAINASMQITGYMSIFPIKSLAATTVTGSRASHPSKPLFFARKPSSRKDERGQKAKPYLLGLFDMTLVELALRRSFFYRIYRKAWIGNLRLNSILHRFRERVHHHFGKTHADFDT